MGLIRDELNTIINSSDTVLAKLVADLFAELVIKTPVDTGALKIAWDLKKVADGWIISNNLDYASIIFEGRSIRSGGVLRGSEQLPQGIQPILDKYNRILEIRLRRV